MHDVHTSDVATDRVLSLSGAYVASTRTRSYMGSNNRAGSESDALQAELSNGARADVSKIIILITHRT